MKPLEEPLTALRKPAQNNQSCWVVDDAL